MKIGFVFLIVVALSTFLTCLAQAQTAEPTAISLATEAPDPTNTPIPTQAPEYVEGSGLFVEEDFRWSFSWDETIWSAEFPSEESRDKVKVSLIPKDGSSVDVGGDISPRMKVYQYLDAENLGASDPLERCKTALWDYFIEIGDVATDPQGNPLEGTFSSDRAWVVFRLDEGIVYFDCSLELNGGNRVILLGRLEERAFGAVFPEMKAVADTFTFTEPVICTDLNIKEPYYVMGSSVQLHDLNQSPTGEFLQEGTVVMFDGGWNGMIEVTAAFEGVSHYYIEPGHLGRSDCITNG